MVNRPLFLQGLFYYFKANSYKTPSHCLAILLLYPSMENKSLIRNTAVKSFFGIGTQTLNSSNYRGTPLGKNGWLFSNDGCDHYFDFTGAGSSLKAYNDCPPVAAIINRKALSYINGKTWILNTSGKAKEKESTNEQATKIRKLFAKPNVMQIGKHFDAQRYMYQQLYGYAIVLMVKTTGFPNYDAESMWLIPNWMVEIEENDNKNFYEKDAPVIKKVIMKYKNLRGELPLDKIFFLKDFRPSFSSIYLPESRIKPLAMPINNIIGAYESSNVLINRRGPNYMVSNGASDTISTIPMTPAEKKEVEDAFKGLGMQRWQSQAIITSANVNVTPVGFDAEKLRLHEEITESSKAICDGFGFPPHLLGLLDPTFNNQNAAEKGLYQNTIIPESESDCDQWNEIFNTSEYGIKITRDFSHITVLQQDKKEFAGARKTLSESLEKEFKNNWITYNRVLELLDEDTVEWGNIYYQQMVAAGFKFGNTPVKLSVDENGNITT